MDQKQDLQRLYNQVVYNHFTNNKNIEEHYLIDTNSFIFYIFL